MLALMLELELFNICEELNYNVLTCTWFWLLWTQFWINKESLTVSKTRNFLSRVPPGVGYTKYPPKLLKRLIYQVSL